MKILYISNGFPPDRWAGTESHTAAIAEEFHRRGASVQVLCAGRWDSGPAGFNGCEDAVWNGIGVRRVHLNWTRFRDPLRDLYDNRMVARLAEEWLREFKPDVVHVTSCETLSASVLRVVKDKALPLVLTLTDFWFLCPRINLLRADGENCDGLTTAWDCTRCLAFHSRIYRWPRSILPDTAVRRIFTGLSRHPALTRRRGLRGMLGNMEGRKTFLQEAVTWPDVRMTASPFVRGVHESNGVVAPILICPYGHDLSWVRPRRNQPASGLRLGYVGQLLRSKGVHLILAALRRLDADVQRRVRVFIYGDLRKSPEYGRELRDLAKGLPGVQFMGTYNHADSAGVYESFDVLVVPSLWYDFPLVIHEALAMKTPVIATRLGGMAEAIAHERNGLLFEKGDVDDLAVQMARLVDGETLLDRLREGIEPVRTIEEEADELQGHYARLT